MKREEAIENLEILKEDYWDDDGYGHETKQYNDTMCALDMAVEALEKSNKIVKAIPLEKLKEVREKMEIDSYTKGIDDVLENLDRLIENYEVEK